MHVVAELLLFKEHTTNQLVDAVEQLRSSIDSLAQEVQLVVAYSGGGYRPWSADMHHTLGVELQETQTGSPHKHVRCQTLLSACY
jgi:hypothetical protein